MNGLYLLFIGSLLSFTSSAQNIVNEPKGNFGGDGKNAPNLKLNPDHTFIYTDLTKASKPIVAEGTWSLEENEVLLKPNSNVHLNKRYTVIRDGLCIKTRKNLAFYTLCNCK